MKAVVLLSAALLCPLLAACNRGPSVEAENATAAELQEKIQAAGGKAEFLTPGLWQSKITMQHVAIPGMPPEMAARMQKAMASRNATSCLTPEQAKKPAAGFFAGGDRQDCRYDHFKMGGGKLDARMTCGDAGRSALMTMKGDYAGDRFRIAMTMESKGAPDGAPAAMAQGMTMAMTIDSRRVGECTQKTGPQG